MGRSRITAVAATLGLSVAGALLGSTEPAYASPPAAHTPATHAPAEAAPTPTPSPEDPAERSHPSDSGADRFPDTEASSARGPSDQEPTSQDPVSQNSASHRSVSQNSVSQRPATPRLASPKPAPRKAASPKSASQEPGAAGAGTDRSTGCTVRTAPPPAIDHSETPKPGQAALGPLPVPAKPVGGSRMGECADILPANAPPLPPGESSASWVLADMDTGAILAARDPHARERPASCLKVLTSLVVLDKLNLDTDVEGTQQDANVDGSRVGVGPQGHYTVRQLLTGLIMNSGNDAANALARQMGGVPATLAAMTDKARSLGGLDTRPATPSGLDAQGMSTSAYDLAVFYRVLMRNPEFAEISRIKLFQWPGHGDQPGFMVSSDNKMLTNYPGTIGGKTGFTDDARHTRIAAAERHGRRLEVVLMRGEQHPVPMDTQAARLLDYGFALPAATPPVGQLVDRAPADYSDGSDTAEQDASSATAPADQDHRTKALPTIGGGVVLGIALSVLIARRRRPRGGGRHTVA